MLCVMVVLLEEDFVGDLVCLVLLKLVVGLE